MHPDHALLASFFGGIKERWNQEHSPMLWNHNDALCVEDTAVGFGGWEKSYAQVCEWEGLPVIVDHMDYTMFAYEGNGNFTAYQRESGEVVMYAHDHNFDHITPMIGCPDYTIYTINDCPDFRTWVETLAGQWLAAIQR